MAKVIKREELDRRFTEAVMKYLNMGLFIATNSMTGHQGEEGKIDLTDGKVTYRILMDTRSDVESKMYMRNVVIEVRKYNEYVTQHMHTLWNDDGELVETFFTAYDIDTYGEPVYVETREEAERIMSLRLKRYREADSRECGWREIKHFDPETVRDAVRTIKGYKRTKKAQIEKIERRKDRLEYRVTIEGKGSVVIR